MNNKEMLVLPSDQIKEIQSRQGARLGIPKQIKEAWQMLRDEYIKDLPELEKEDRRLIFGFGNKGQAFRLRQRDIVRALAEAELDLGILGMDEYFEAILAGLPIIRLGQSLNFGECKFGLGVRTGDSLDINVLRANLAGSQKIATSYPMLARCLH